MTKIRVERPQRLIGLTLAVLALAIVLALQAVAGVTLRQAPQVAVGAMPMNGLAQERLAFATFRAEATDPTDPQIVLDAAAAAEPIARHALRMEALLPKAHAILALNIADQAEQGRFLAAALRLNRRDASLQGVALQNFVAAGDYDGVFGAVDRLLRVNPEMSEQLFPILLNAFREDAGLESMKNLVEADPTWLSRFLLYAVEQPTVLSELAEFRSQVDLPYTGFDQRLVARLVEEGDVERAYRFYRQFAQDAGESVDDGELDWEVGYPPFDWVLIGQNAMRAQIQRDDSGMEVNIRPGGGGTLASRVVALPEGQFALEITHDIGPIAQLEKFRIRLNCVDGGAVLLDQPLTAGTPRFVVDQEASGCRFARLILQARVSAIDSPMFGPIDSIKISQP